MLELLKNDLQKLADKKRAKQCLRFHKTGKGDYAEGDKFLGITGPDQRLVAKKYIEIKLPDLQKLINSPWHEHRQTSFLILVYKYQKAKDDKIKKQIFDFYIKNRKYANNWDLVDVSTPHVVGNYVLEFNKNKNLLYKYAESKNLWERRIAILATFSFIRDNKFEDTLKISKILLNDKHDLIHKAVGWMLREVGKRNQKVEEEFLKKYYKKMPRTMLRYAIEKFEETKRQKYLKSKI
jgi:3-methyladenine DNA glycosylase AlkD